MIASCCCCRVLLTYLFIYFFGSTSIIWIPKDALLNWHLATVEAIGSYTTKQLKTIWALWHGPWTCWIKMHCGHRGMDAISNNTQVGCDLWIILSWRIVWRGTKCAKKNPSHHYTNTTSSSVTFCNLQFWWAFENDGLSSLFLADNSGNSLLLQPICFKVWHYCAFRDGILHFCIQVAIWVILFVSHFDAQFEFQQVFLTMFMCLNALLFVVSEKSCKLPSKTWIILCSFCRKTFVSLSLLWPYGVIYGKNSSLHIYMQMSKTVISSYTSLFKLAVHHTCIICIYYYPIFHGKQSINSKQQTR